MIKPYNNPREASPPTRVEKGNAFFKLAGRLYATNGLTINNPILIRMSRNIYGKSLPINDPTCNPFKPTWLIKVTLGYTGMSVALYFVLSTLRKRSPILTNDN